jgi:Baseplate J-like protein
MTAITESPRRDYLARDYDSLLAAMRALIPEKRPDWTDYRNEADLGNVLLQLFAHLGDSFSYYTDRLANESLLGTAQTRRSIIHQLRLVGYSLATATPATTQLTLTFPADCNQIITLSKGDAFATSSQNNQPPVRFEYLGENLEIDCQSYKQYVGIPVTEGYLIREEFLGTSTGTPNQRLRLAHAGLILRPGVNNDIGLQVNQVPWTLRETLAFSRNQQTDFMIEIDEDDWATVIFGDGDFGAIPAAGAEIKATYRVGGGTHGNVAANTIQTILAPSPLTQLGVKVTHSQAATGGAERESIEAAVLRAPVQFQRQQRAVAAVDYQTLAQNFSGVGKVRAVATSWNTVILYLAPAGGGLVSDVLKANLLAYFEDQRPVTTTIEIEAVDYVKIYVTAEIGIKTYYDPPKVKAQVQQAAGQLLAFNQVEFGQTLYLSKFYEAIEATEGVDYVTITEFRREIPSHTLNFTSTLTDHQITTYFDISGKTPDTLEPITVSAAAEITVAADADAEMIHQQIRAHAQQLPVFTPPLDVGQLGLYLEPFYQDIEELVGVVKPINVLALAYPTAWSPVTTSGKIELAAHEIPQIPNDSRYQSGIKVIVLEEV